MVINNSNKKKHLWRWHEFPSEWNNLLPILTECDDHECEFYYRNPKYLLPIENYENPEHLLWFHQDKIISKCTDKNCPY
jgi:hypothetical protein